MKTKNVKRAYLCLRQGLFWSVVLTCSANFAHPNQGRTELRVLLIDFLYVQGEFPISRELEQEVIFPAIDQALNVAGSSGHRIHRLTRQGLKYFLRSEAVKRVGSKLYDIAIWGHVTPFDGMLRNYNLDLMVFTNPDRYEDCIFYYHLEIRDTRIIRWNNSKCNMPEAACASIASILCCRIESLSLVTAREPQDVNLELDPFSSKILALYGIELSLSEVVNWNPAKGCDLEQTRGFMQLELVGGDELTFSLPSPLFSIFCANISDGARYNSPIELKFDPDRELRLYSIFVHGKVTSDSAQPLEANITYGRLGSGKSMGKATTNPQTGEYSITFPFEEWYGQQDTIWYSFYFNKENYLPVHKNLDLRKSEQRYQEIEMDVVLHPIEDPYAAGKPKKAPQEIVLENVFFDLNKYELRPESFEQLDFLADSLMSRYPSLEVIIAGHTDNTGSEDHNLELSQRRAEAVISYLVERSIARHRFQAQWFGATKPVATNDTEEGRQKNRRVTFQISRFEPLGIK